MGIIEAIFFGLVQGITEFLPVSSSGHLVLFGLVFNIDSNIMMSFSTLLHMGTLISVFVVMRKEIVEILRDILGRRTWQLVLATIPAFLAAFFLGDWLDSLFGGSTLGFSFLATAVILIIAVVWKRKKPPVEDVGYREAVIGGIGQAIAIVPGISRSGTTITALLLSGVDRDKAIRFSFLMSIPAILGGFAFDVKKMIEGQGSAIASLGIGNIIIGVLAAAISGWLVMEFMLRKLNRRGFLYCAIYVALLGCLILCDQYIFHLVF